MNMNDLLIFVSEIEALVPRSLLNITKQDPEPRRKLIKDFANKIFGPKIMLKAIFLNDLSSGEIIGIFDDVDLIEHQKKLYAKALLEDGVTEKYYFMETPLTLNQLIYT